MKIRTALGHDENNSRLFLLLQRGIIEIDWSYLCSGSHWQALLTGKLMPGFHDYIPIAFFRQSSLTALVRSAYIPLGRVQCCLYVHTGTVRISLGPIAPKRTCVPGISPEGKHRVRTALRALHLAEANLEVGIDMLKTLFPNKGQNVMEQQEEQGTSAQSLQPTSPLWSITQVSCISSNSQATASGSPAQPVQPPHPRLRPLNSMCAWSSSCRHLKTYSEHPLPRLSHGFLLHIGTGSFPASFFPTLFLKSETRTWSFEAPIALLPFYSSFYTPYYTYTALTCPRGVPSSHHRILFSQPSLQNAFLFNCLSKSMALIGFQ